MQNSGIQGYSSEKQALEACARNNYEIDSIIFDLDGTLWDSTPVVADAWNRALNRYPEAAYTTTPDGLKQLFGRPMNVIADLMLPHLEPEKRYQIMDECCEEEEIALRHTPGVLYPKLEQTLEILSSRYPLFIVSNCQSGYIETFLESTGLGKYFKDFECPGNTGLVKGPNNKLVIERNHLIHPVYVGDTQGDKDSAVYAEIPFCYAAYGFGTVDSSDYRIETFSDLLTLL
ncbi:MAG: HAD family hydrolase [Lachnospiraceae bacterium]|nr:HAD family hydrolase [Lachnospiraceae bacterium]